MKTYEVLEKALARIEDEKNWCQGSYGPKKGPNCAVGALVYAEATRSIHDRPVAEALVALGAFTGGSLVDFNDSRTHPEVVELFQKAIRAEKQKAGIVVDVPTTTEQEVAA